MERELAWPGPSRTRNRCPDDPAQPQLLSRQPAVSGPASGPLQPAFVLEQYDEDRRVSTAGAFSMFLFGVISGAVWALFLTWLFS